MRDQRCEIVLSCIIADILLGINNVEHLLSVAGTIYNPERSLEEWFDDPEMPLEYNIYSKSGRPLLK